MVCRERWHHHVTGVHVIPVAKDIDALLALSFGQVQAALVTPDSVEVLKRINPGASAKFRTVYTTSPILRAFSLVEEVGERRHQHKSLRQADLPLLQQMGKSDDGRAKPCTPWALKAGRAFNRRC